MENNTSSNAALQVYLAEYKALRSEIEARLGHQQSLVNWACIFFAAISGILFTYPVAFDNLIQMRLQWVLLFVPLFFSFMAFAYQEQHRIIADLGCYLNAHLRSKVCSLINEKEAFAWEDYLSYSRSEMKLLDKIMCNARYILLIVMATLWWLFFILVSLYLRLSWGYADWTLVVINAFLIVTAIYSYFPISERFARIIEEKKRRKAE